MPGSHWPDVEPLEQAFTLFTPDETMRVPADWKRMGPNTPIDWAKRLCNTLSYASCWRGPIVTTGICTVLTTFPAPSER